ncbi:hypothetical protein Tco_0356025 [Tanacetum coccineum]
MEAQYGKFLDLIRVVRINVPLVDVLAGMPNYGKFHKELKSLDEPPTDLELKPLLDYLEYAFLEEPSFLPVIITSQLFKQNKEKLISVLKRHKQALAWKTTDIPSICPSFC